MDAEMKKYPQPASIPVKNREWLDHELKKSPTWCSVDLRDGNQALPMPMNPEKKFAYFQLLCQIGFKEIEVSFPSASQDDFEFVRELITGKKIPQDVRISVLTQAREPLIRRTVESLAGLDRGILHLYIATSELHEQIVFHKNHEETLKTAVEGTKSVIRYLKEAGLYGKISYEFSPEEFTDSDLDHVLDVCKAVKEAWGPCKKEDFILNLPQTVERRPPHHYADMIAWFIEHYPYMDETTISIHSHNDQGCAIASSEMAVMAGAERVEGTLFGHGERTGNVDLCAMSLNLESRNINTGLNFSDLPHIVKVVEQSTGIEVHERHPYAGQLAFTAFSGSHQDAIRKGLDSLDKARKIFGVEWKVPYLHIDPASVGRKYEKLIRINSQSGKGGVAYVLEHDYGIYPPKGMHPEIGAAIQAYADRKGDELNSSELLEIFNTTFVNIKGPFDLRKFARVSGGDHDENLADSVIGVSLQLVFDGKAMDIRGSGNGPISATVHAIRDEANLYQFVLEDFSERTLGTNADANAIAFVGIRRKSDNRLFYGVGEHANIDQAAIAALFSALNRAILEERGLL
ncbi:MAG: 2-isopropylmalate synthase [Lentisphaeria bacterium]|nr:2-isopropylmalate synthase [Lentisphaeria bacterium]